MTLSDSTAVSRRSLLAQAGTTALGAGIAAACAPAAAPTGPAPAASQPAAQAPSWQKEWDDTVAAAKKEGKLVLILQQQNEGFRKAIETFEQTFPGVTVETQGFASSSLVIPKIQQEQAAGVYTYDAIQHSITSFLTTLKPAGNVVSVAPVIFRSDVKEDSLWSGGFDGGWVDTAKTVYMFNWYASSWWVNTDLVREGEIRSIKDLLAPKWKGGKIGIIDVRSGSTFNIMLAVRQNLGDEALKQLLVDQQPVFNRDERTVTEQLIRGQIAITNARVQAFIQDYRDKGLGKNTKSIDLPESRVALSAGGLWLMKNAPHPNAAKLFINWLLTKEGQLAWNATGIGNSRRVDIPPFDPDGVIDKNSQYLVVAREENLTRASEILKYLTELVN
ncbi:MAG: extracellular solute-binding protein [Dehalococcoidia bacterium]|nr:extracellular solute-binding protein [Dehalococcoidia bacterium]